MKKRIVLAAVARTPVGRIGGALSNLSAIDLGAIAVEGAISRSGGLPIDTIVMANVAQAGNGQNPGRLAAIRGGANRNVTGITLNNVCLSSMSAIVSAKRLLQLGEANSVLVGGFESMSCGLVGNSSITDHRKNQINNLDLIKNDGLWCSIDGIGMGELSEKENNRLGISRLAQDEWAIRSHKKAVLAESFRKEFMYVGDRDIALVDEGVRTDTSLEKISAMKPAFVRNGSITAANSSQMSDAGAAGFVSFEEVVRSHGILPLVEIVDAEFVAGLSSALHLMPSAAAKKLLTKNKLVASDIGAWEINEAFAGVVLASIADLGIEEDRVNTSGGAIAIGHPLAASAFRITMSLISTMRHENHEFGIAAICGGGGQGKAILLKQI